jgi:hypothetical protein
MLLRTMAILALLTVVASMVFSMWRSGVIRSWMTTTPDKPRAIVFDNGSIRDVPGPAASESRKGAALSPPGVLRKCLRGDQVTYSNLTCPPGFRERPVSTDGVTVVPAFRPPEASARPASGSAHQRLQESLDLKRDDKLRQRMIDQAVEGGSR